MRLGQAFVVEVGIALAGVGLTSSSSTLSCHWQTYQSGSDLKDESQRDRVTTTPTPNASTPTKTTLILQSPIKYTAITQ